MSRDDDLVALVGSRICHDLVSPLGAIGNGVELMTLTGGEETPELDLVQESLAHARARIRFFRIAFGAAPPEAVVRRAELAEALAAGERRAALDWPLPDHLPRIEAKLALLALDCLDAAMPFGGTVRVTASECLEITGTAERLRLDEAAWRLLDTPHAPATPDTVQFALLPRAAAAAGRTLGITRDPGRIRMRL